MDQTRILCAHKTGQVSPAHSAQVGLLIRASDQKRKSAPQDQILTPPTYSFLIDPY